MAIPGEADAGNEAFSQTYLGLWSMSDLMLQKTNA
jgi:hypothetical protein